MKNKKYQEAARINPYGNLDQLGSAPASAFAPPVSAKGFRDRELFVYAVSFDKLTDYEKAATIVTLLDMLPSVKEMRSYLGSQHRLSKPSLREWHDRIPPAALGLLRWIIASNRSSIVQVDACPGQDDVDINNRFIKVKDQVAGIAGWTQCEYHFIFLLCIMGGLGGHDMHLGDDMYHIASTIVDGDIMGRM